MEESLIQRAQEGDKVAFNSLIGQYRETMFRYAYLIVSDAQIAEDVTQDAILRIYKYLNRFDKTHAFRPWALQITRNVARNNNRSWGRYKHMVKRLITFHQRDSVNVESLTVAQQHAQHLHEAVHQLKNDHQDIIYTRFFLDLSVEEAAHILGIAEGTVKSRSHRALKQLKVIIEQHYPHLKLEASDE